MVVYHRQTYCKKDWIALLILSTYAIVSPISIYLLVPRAYYSKQTVGIFCDIAGIIGLAI